MSVCFHHDKWVCSHIDMLYYSCLKINGWLVCVGMTINEWVCAYSTYIPQLVWLMYAFLELRHATGISGWSGGRTLVVLLNVPRIRE